MVSNDSVIQQFIKQHQLTNAYSTVIEQHVSAIAESLVLHHNSAKRPIIIGIHGAQGSGKTTLAAALVMLFKHRYHKQAVSLSLDDFYLTRAARQQLADKVHPLLRTRGVPGTHDVKLAIDTLKALSQQQSMVAIPRFNKAIDDRFAESQWPQIQAPVDLIVIEGWCLGASPQTDEMLIPAVNTLESEEDPDVSWRRFVNQQLKIYYPALFSCIDKWLMLQAPDFSCVFNWRMEQEDKLRQAVANDPSNNSAVMDPPSMQRFIQHYQRISEHCMTSLPKQMDYIIELGRDREIIGVKQQYQRTHFTEPQLLIFTDLDGSLLDHHNYRHDEADGLLAALEDQAVPVIPVSSKTQTEIELLRDSLKNRHPFIVENGAAVLVPVGYFPEQPADTQCKDGYWIKEFVAPRSHWQQLIKEVKADFSTDFTTFADAGIDGIIAMTGLNVHAAARAARRHYGEPVAWHSSPGRQQQFINALEQRGATILHGGRFMHVSGDCNKGSALQWLVSVYRQNNSGQQFVSLAVGDSQNDCAMLEQADLALMIRSPVHGLPELNRHFGVFVSKDTGPRGWAQGVRDIVLSSGIQFDLNEESS